MNFGALFVIYSRSCLLWEAEIEERSKGGRLSNGITMLPTCDSLSDLFLFEAKFAQDGFPNAHKKRAE
jgi:hypothetical protein